MVDPLPQLYVDAVTYSEENEAKQEELHYDDRLASWFTIRPDLEDKDLLRLIVTDRFRQLCNPGIAENKWIVNQYPSFVSLIGNTGVGKSTLLRAMLLLGQLRATGYDAADKNREMVGLRNIVAARAQGPVTRSANLLHLTNPTSLGVHLYKDAPLAPDDQTFTESIPGQHIRYPILFADCEGFGAGNASLTSERISRQDSPSTLRKDRDRSAARSERSSMRRRASGETNSAFTRSRPFKNAISDSPILAESYKHGRGPELFYARFLYAMSDVLVFVTKDDQTFQADMQRLMEWSAAAIYNSVNHVAHKTLIIVRNMPVLHNADLFEPQILKSTLFRNLKPLWEASVPLTEFVKNYNSGQIQRAEKIEVNEDLFRVFFQNINACYIPDKRGRPAAELFKQYGLLRDQITRASFEGQKNRRKCWIQYNVPALSHILNRAFEHFRTSDKPFDFYVAARNDNPNPVSMGEHIANLLRHLHELRSENPLIRARIIAICLVCWAMRYMGQETVYNPDDIWDRHIKGDCETALRIFANRYQRCSFTFADGTPCIVRRTTHDQHCNERGTRQPGVFTESYLKKDLQNDPLLQIRKEFVALYETTCGSTSHSGPILPSLSSFRQIRENTFREFISIWKHIRSNKTCFTCLQIVPDHVLPYGHVYCIECVKEFGKPSEYFESAWEMLDCALCGTRWYQSPQLIRLKPRCAGVRILSLDGGGVRGIVELAVLEQLLAKVDLGLPNPVPELFDLVMGTSTGGIISLCLVHKVYMPIATMKEKFLELAKRTFEKDRSGFIGRFDPLQLFVKALMLMRVTDSIYSPDPLRECLVELFEPDVRLFSSPTRTHFQRSTRVAVTSTKDRAANRCLITNYNRQRYSSDQSPDLIAPCEDDFEREDEDKLEMKIWEAGIATAAAPFYFPAFYKPETKKDYVDGALHANFPGSYALEEMDNIWSTYGVDAALDIMVSIGTGRQTRDVALPAALKIGGFDAICTNFHKNIESERLFRDFVNGPGSKPGLQGKIHRLNAEIFGDYVALYEYKKMRDLNAMVSEQTKNTVDGSPSLSSSISSLANILLANLFFFEPDENFAEGMEIVTLSPYQKSHHVKQFKGSIRCRLAYDSAELKSLVHRIEGFHHAELWLGRTTSVEEPRWTVIPFSDNQRNAIRTKRERFRVNFTMKTEDEVQKQQVIVVSFRNESLDVKNSISGFPVTLMELKKRAGIRP
ncbi:hypothetical protein NA57DRAFT_80664 [Rhizodiscina lignyota]|uniref:PNPLA domain-containing protein n=1 Tax=Rhizodiscina lignyota TaxID=1504668 RepID=A0A9P4I392_9PEZI|nr:hypothetical protein NA57DRAFT_80664 [Rhizodiscina lignyota]